jgi:hypothetical protein
MKNIVTETGILMHDFMSKYNLSPNSVYIGSLQRTELELISTSGYTNTKFNWIDTLFGLNIVFVSDYDYLAVCLELKPIEAKGSGLK